MTRISFRSVAIVGVLAAFSAAGCCQKEKDEILKLNSQYNNLRQETETLRSDLAKAQSDRDALQAQLAQKDNELNATKTATAAAPKGPATAAGWQRTAYGDKVEVGSDVLFSPGSATLSSGGQRALAKIVTDLKTNYANLPVRVYGFTDSDPISKSKKSWADNLDLSANRAMAVTRYLEQHGVSGSRIETIAMGENHPVASNSSREGKQKNRRVEIVVVR